MSEVNVEKLKAGLVEHSKSGGHKETRTMALVILNGIERGDSPLPARLSKTLGLLRKKASGRGKIGPAYGALCAVFVESGVAEAEASPP